MERINIVDLDEKSDISKTTKKPYSYLEIKLDTGDTFRLMGDPKKVVEEGGVGFYNAKFEPNPKNPKYQFITEVVALGASPSPAKTAQAPTSIRDRLKPSEPSMSDSILYQVCLKVAAEIVAAKISLGRDIPISENDVSPLAARYFNAAKKTLDPELEETPF